MFLIAISVITCMIGLIRKQYTKAIVTAMQIDLYPISHWIPPYDDVDNISHNWSTLIVNFGQSVISPTL